MGTVNGEMRGGAKIEPHAGIREGALRIDTAQCVDYGNQLKHSCLRYLHLCGDGLSIGFWFKLTNQTDTKSTADLVRNCRNNGCKGGFKIELSIPVAGNGAVNSYVKASF